MTVLPLDPAPSTRTSPSTIAARSERASRIYGQGDSAVRALDDVTVVDIDFPGTQSQWFEVAAISNPLDRAVNGRTREIGMLRAVGATRKQVRAMVRNEAACGSRPEFWPADAWSPDARV